MEIFIQLSCDVKRQHWNELYNIYIELTFSSYTAPKEVILDPNARIFSPKRNAAVAANEQIKEETEYETELPDVE